MKKKEKDDLFAARISGALHYHQKMLADGVRNKLLYEAIKTCVSNGRIFSTSAREPAFGRFWRQSSARKE